LHGFEAKLRVFAQILRGGLRIENRNESDADKAARIVTAKIMKPCIVRAKNGALKRAVG
jgi:hypothetical protein